MKFTINDISMTKKILHQISDKELLDILENADSLPNILITTKTDVLDFIYALRITKGENKVTTGLLYRLYKNWSKNPIARQIFTNEAALIIETATRFRKETCFMINLDENVLLKKTLEYVKKIDKTKRKPDKRHFDNYLNRYQIKKGSFFVKDLVLFNLYDKWTYENNKPHSLSFLNFNKFCQLYFKPYKIIENRFWYGLDNSIIKYFTEEMKKQMVIREKRRYQRSQLKQKIR